VELKVAAGACCVRFISLSYDRKRKMNSNTAPAEIDKTAKPLSLREQRARERFAWNNA
jgi:hypothetical protein